MWYNTRMPNRFSRENRELKSLGQRRCSACELVLDLEKFTPPHGRCSTCLKQANRQYAAKTRILHRERCLEANRRWSKEIRAKRWKNVLSLLGSACRCCGETEPYFLTVDHINNDGYKETQKAIGGKWRGRAGGEAYKQILEMANPHERFQILCYNCNCGRARTQDKVCPHQRSHAAVA